MDGLEITQGSAPMILSLPHTGTMIPDDLMDHFVSQSVAVHDCDLYVDRLYGFAQSLGITTIRTPWSRSVIDVNRDPLGQSLYPGQFTTGLCPIETFEGHSLYREGFLPDAHEIDRRRALYFAPYHTAIRQQIDRLRSHHARIVLYDAHSIISRSERLFSGQLPLFNIGTNDGASCDPRLSRAVLKACVEGDTVLNGRFKGGYITRHYADPSHGIHTIQMELAMRGYLDEGHTWPPPWDEARAQPMMMHLRDVITACLDFTKEAL